MNVASILLAYVLVQSAAVQTAPEKTFRVHVVNSVTRAPIAGANVVLSSEKDEGLWGRTDVMGLCTVRPHSAGSHVLTVTRKGYRMTSNGMGQMIDVKQAVDTETTVEMQPLGALSGRVLDQYGDPVRNAIVRTEDAVGEVGEDESYEGSSAAITDDRGEYRMAEVEPGKHYVAIEYTTDERHTGTRSTYSWPLAGAVMLYPDAVGIAQAEQVQAVAGTTVCLNDVHLRIQRALTISGHVRPPPSTPRASVSLERRLKLALNAFPLVQGVSLEPDGRFTVAAIPGTYKLEAADSESGRVSKPLLLELNDKDISGLELELTAGYEITGRIQIDGNQHMDLSKLLLNFGGAEVGIDENGVFKTQLMGGTGRYTLQELPEDWYVKAFQVAGKRIEGSSFETEPGTTEVVFTLSPNGARVTVNLDKTVSRLDAVYAVLLPETGRVPDVESVPTAQMDEAGGFNFRGVCPGSYRVFTLNAANQVLVMSPDLLLEKYRNLVPVITVAEGEQKKVVVPFVTLQVP